MTKKIVWIDGVFDRRIDPFDRGLLLGDGVFDTLTAFRGLPFAGERHRARLHEHAAAVGISLDLAKVDDGWKAVLAKTGNTHVILRTTVTRGISERGLWPAQSGTPTIIVAATPWHADLFAKPVRLITSSIRRNAQSPTSRLKSLNYLDNILAMREAAAKGADDALMLNHLDQVACTTIANCFALLGGALVSPPVSDGIMAGIIRALALEAAPAAGLAPQERSLWPAELFEASAVFLTNSVRLLSPVVSIDGKKAAESNKLTMALLESLVAKIHVECGIDPRHA